MSMPRAATSVQMRKRTSPSLKAASACLLSCMLLAPASTTQLYGFSNPFSTLPLKDFVALPPPRPFRKFSSLSQSKLVRQKMRHWSIS